MEDGDLAWALQPQPYLRFQPLTVFWLQSEGGWLSIALVPNAISGETLRGRSASPGRKGELERLDQGAWSKITREYAKYYAVQCPVRMLLGRVSLGGSGNQEGRLVHGRPVNSSPVPLLKDRAHSLSESLEGGTPSAWTF